MDSTYPDYWNVPYQIPPDQYSSHPKGEKVKEAKENAGNTCLPQQTGRKFQGNWNQVTPNSLKTSCTSLQDETSRSPLTQYTKKCSTPSFAQYMMEDERGASDDLLLKDNTSYLFLDANQLATSHSQQETTRRNVKDAIANSEASKPFSVSPPKPSLTSDQMSQFWIPPPVKSAEQEGGCYQGQIGTGMLWEKNGNDVASKDVFSTTSLHVKSQGNMKDFYRDRWATACSRNSPPLSWDATSETPFNLFSKHSTIHDGKDMGDELEGKHSTHNAGYLEIPSTTSPGTATQERPESVGWDYLFTADTHHSADYEDISSVHPPPTSYSHVNANEVQYKDYWESELVQDMTKEKCPQKTVHNDQAWKTSNEGSSHYHFENDCHGRWFTLSPPSAHHWFPSVQTPPQALPTSFFTSHLEETQHEDLDVSELVDEVVKNVNTNSMELNHQIFTASTDQLSHDRCVESEYYLDTTSNMQQSTECTTMPLKTYTDSISKYDGFTPEANYQIEHTHKVRQVYEVAELEKCPQYHEQATLQTVFEDQQHTMERREYNEVPYDYSSREEESGGNKYKIVYSEDKFGKHAKNITEYKKLGDDEWNVEVTTDENRKTDGDEEMDKDEKTNEEETEEEDEDEEEETDKDECNEGGDVRSDEDDNVVEEEVRHEESDEDIDGEEFDEDEDSDIDDDFDTEFEEDEEFDDSEELEAEFERDEEFDIDTGTSSEFTVGEVDTDSDASSFHSGYCFSGQTVSRSHGCNDIRVFAYSTSAGSSQAASIEMKDNSIEQCSNVIATDSDEALSTISEEDECSAQNGSKECTTSSIPSLDRLHKNEDEPSMTTLDAREEDLECSPTCSVAISDDDLDEISTGVTHTQEVTKVGCCTTLPFLLFS